MASPTVAANAYASLAKIMDSAGGAGGLGKPGDANGPSFGEVLKETLGGKILKPYYGYGDNEGILSTIPAVATALLGVLAGFWLTSGRSQVVQTYGRRFGSFAGRLPRRTAPASGM